MRNTNLTSDEAVALLREDRAAVNEFLREFAEVNAIQAKHGDDVQRLLQLLPGTLGKVNKAFEPTTGLIRFGLIQENDEPGLQLRLQPQATGGARPTACLRRS